MTEDEAINIVYDGLAGPASLIIKLRAGEGLDLDLLDQVKRAARFLVDQMRARTDVPKRLAYAFLDIQAAFQNEMLRYDDHEQLQIEAASIALVELGLEIFDPDGGAPRSRRSVFPSMFPRSR